MTSDTKILKILLLGSTTTFFGIIISKILNYSFRATVSRLLGPANYGVLNILIAIIGIASLISIMGLNQAVQRYVGFYKGYKNIQLKVIKVAIKISILPLSSVCILILLFSNKLSNIFFNTSDYSLLIKILVIYIISNVFLELLLSFFKGLNLVRKVVLLKNITEPCLKIIFLIIASCIGYKLTGALISIILASLLSFIFSINFFKKIYKKLNVKISAKNIRSDLISFSWPLIFTGLLASLMYWMDTLMIGYFSEEYFVGIYNAATPIAEVLTIFLISFSITFVPILANLYQKRNLKSIREIYAIISKWILLLASPLIVTILLFPERLISLLFGIEYTSGAWPLRLLSIGYFFYIIVGPTSEMLNVIAKTKIKLILRIILISTNFALNLYLIPKYNLIGAAFATMISIIVYNSSILLILKRKIQIKLKIIKNLPLVLSLNSLLCIPWLIYINQKIPILITILLYIIFLQLYYLLVILFGIKSFEEKNILESILKKLKIS